MSLLMKGLSAMRSKNDRAKRYEYSHIVDEYHTKYITPTLKTFSIEVVLKLSIGHTWTA